MIETAFVLSIALLIAFIVAAFWVGEALRKEKITREDQEARKEGSLQFLRNEISMAHQAQRSFETTLESHESRLKNHDRAAGGFWLTAKKDLLRIRDMSTGHLRNCLRAPISYAMSPELRKLMEHEIARREEDARWRDADEFEQRLKVSAALTSIRRLAEGMSSPASGPMRTQVENLEQALRGKRGRPIGFTLSEWVTPTDIRTKAPGAKTTRKVGKTLAARKKKGA